MGKMGREIGIISKNKEDMIHIALVFDHRARTPRGNEGPIEVRINVNNVFRYMRVYVSGIAPSVNLDIPSYPCGGIIICSPVVGDALISVSFALFPPGNILINDIVSIDCDIRC